MLIKSKESQIDWRDPKIGEDKPEKENEKQNGNIKSMFKKDADKRGKNCGLSKSCALNRKFVY